MSTFLHSSMLPSGSPLPKTVGGKTKSMEKRERDTADDRQWREVCRDVDTRDAGHCRICGRRVVLMAVDSRERAERNHIIKRSQGGPDTTANVHLICASKCHDDIHKRGITRVSGDADARDEKGRLCGIKVERLRREGWVVTAWV